MFLVLLFLTNLSFSQSDQDNYEIYSKVISEQLKFGINAKIDSLILMEKYSPKIQPDFDVFENLTADSIPNADLWYLSIQTYNNHEFVKRVMHDAELKMAMKEFVTDFQNHPTLNDELLKTDKLNIQTITSRQYDSYFGKKPKRNEKAWKKVQKKYGTKQIIGFSKINYYKNFATLYYERHCGQLCGSGNMVVFEKIKDKWIILSEINFWMS